jgi:GntR family transcriptional regulator of arabinose operon
MMILKKSIDISFVLAYISRHIGRQLMNKKEQTNTGKRELLRTFLLDTIRTGTSNGEARVPSRAELMDKFKCARATVDFVIGNLQKEGVLLAEKGKGTFAAEFSHHLQIEAVAIVSLSSYSYAREIEYGILSHIGSAYPVSRFNAEEIKIPATWEKCKAHKAIIFVMPDAIHEPYLDDVRKKKIPHIVAYRDPPESSFVSIDVRATVCSIVKKLHERGHKKIGWFGLTQSRFHFPERRYAGYLEGLLETGMEFNRELITISPDIDDTIFLESLFSKSHLKPDALILAQKPMKTVLPVLEKYKIRIGKEITIVSLDQIYEGTYPFPVICVDRMTTETGIEAGKIALELCTNRDKTAVNTRRYIAQTIVELS